MFWIIVLYQIYQSFVNTFSQSVAYLLIFMTLSFAEQKSVILTKSSLPIVSVMDMSLMLHLKSYSCTQGDLGFLLCFRSFIVLHVIFRSMINFANFCEGSKACI